MSMISRRRLDMPEVHRLITAQRRMLDNWSETPAGSDDRRRLWQELHLAGDALADLAYGGPRLRTRLSYWLRPYDSHRDARCWRWQQTRCRPLVLSSQADRRPHPDVMGTTAQSAAGADLLPEALNRPNSSKGQEP